MRVAKPRRKARFVIPEPTRKRERPHWHIDYLRPHTTLDEVWFCHDRKSREHEWASCFAGMMGASVPLAGFGSSDCDCESHLFFFNKCWNKQQLCLPPHRI